MLASSATDEKSKLRVRKSVARIPGSGSVPNQNVTDPQHCYLRYLAEFLFQSTWYNTFTISPLLVSNTKRWFRAQRQSEAYATDNYILTMLNQLPPTKELLQVGLT
jgi:hypothetical protein